MSLIKINVHNNMQINVILGVCFIRVVGTYTARRDKNSWGLMPFVKRHAYIRLSHSHDSHFILLSIRKLRDTSDTSKVKFLLVEVF